MNIKEAKKQICQAVSAYRTRDEYGRPVIPLERQRPVFLLGAPGIGKTAIMEQIAQEMGIALVSYSMTHHTRQSALGLPFIREKQYGEQTFRVSEYTMSEIIASVYDKMEQTGVREGILFLDEINCVSETLAPAMLQFLQYKVFGQHRVPEGWIVVTAGNPPEYNQSVREFDMATWDRLKRIDVEPDYEVWREYALDHGVHPAILSFLDIRKGDFCSVETTVDGKRFVTPRGWVDLSDMIRLYEQHEFKVNEQLVRQYLQNPKVAKQFAIYYDLWLKYRSDYQIDAILAGKAPEAILKRAKSAKFDERISLLGLMMDGILDIIRPVIQERTMMEAALKELKETRETSAMMHRCIKDTLEESIKKQRNRLKRELAGNMLSSSAERTLRMLIAFMSEMHEKAADTSEDGEALAQIKKAFDDRAKALKESGTDAVQKMNHLFEFMEQAFGEGQEMLILVTEITTSEDAAKFVARYGCDAYFKHNKELLFYERQVQVIDALEEGMGRNREPEFVMV